MSMLQTVGLLIISILLNAGGSFALKHAALSGQPAWGLLGGGCYVLGAAIYLLVLQHQPLAIMAVVTSVLGLILVVLIGVFAFGESMSLTRLCGLVLGLAGVALTLLPSSST